MRVGAWSMCILVMLYFYLITPGQTSGSRGQIINFSALQGKSSAQIEQLLGKPSRTHHDPRLQPWCDEMRSYKVGKHLHVGFRRDRAVLFSYAFERNQIPSTPEAALLAVGIDVHDTPPRRVDQLPAAGSIRLLGMLGEAKKNYVLWTGNFSGIQWDWLLAQGGENRRHKLYAVVSAYSAGAAL